jgi:hypothetical protein
LCSVTFLLCLPFMRSDNVQQQMTDNMAHAHCMLDTQRYKYTLTICNVHCFSTTTMVGRTRLIVASYLHCSSPRIFLSQDLCKLPVAVSLQSTDVPLGHAVPIFPSLCTYLQTQITPRAGLRVCAHSLSYAPRHCNVHLLTVLTHYL